MTVMSLSFRLQTENYNFPSMDFTSTEHQQFKLLKNQQSNEQLKGTGFIKYLSDKKLALLSNSNGSFAVEIFIQKKNKK